MHKVVSPSAFNAFLEKPQEFVLTAFTPFRLQHLLRTSDGGSRLGRTGALRATETTFASQP